MLLYLLVFIPISLALYYLTSVSEPWIFISAVFAVVPLAEMIRRATKELAQKAGSSIGGLLNVTFGNAAEMIIALFILVEGKFDVVKGQLTGSIIGNSLLGLGLAILIGTWGKKRLTFNRDQVGQLSTMLMLVLIGLLLPAIFDFTERNIANVENASMLDENLSLAVSIVLILLYIANLVYTLITHEDLFSKAEKVDERIQPGESPWPVWRSLLIMLVSTAFTAWEAELISKSLELSAAQIGVSEFFLGVVVLAIIGNMTEYVTGIFFAQRERMTVAMSISVGGTIQVALFVAPLLVIVSNVIGTPMNLVFSNPIELVAIASAAFTIEAISRDGEVTWFEGALLIGVYVLMAAAFFFVTSS
jgi:Ca2+:H+ antiporter